MSTARDFLAAVQQRADAATPGPWKFSPAVGDVVEGPGVLTSNGLAHEIDFRFSEGGRDQGCYDAEFIAASRTDVPRLVAALTAVLDVAEEMDKNPQTRLDVSTAAMLRAVITAALTPKENDS